MITFEFSNKDKTKIKGLQFALKYFKVFENLIYFLFKIFQNQLQTTGVKV